MESKSSEVNLEQVRFNREQTIRFLRATGFVLIGFELFYLAGKVSPFFFSFSWLGGILFSLLLIWGCWKLPVYSRSERRLIISCLVLSGLVRVYIGMRLMSDLMDVGVADEMPGVVLTMLAIPAIHAILCVVFALCWLCLPRCREYFRVVDRLHDNYERFEGADFLTVRVEDVLEYDD